MVEILTTIAVFKVKTLIWISAVTPAITFILHKKKQIKKRKKNGKKTGRQGTEKLFYGLQNHNFFNKRNILKKRTQKKLF